MKLKNDSKHSKKHAEPVDGDGVYVKNTREELSELAQWAHAIKYKYPEPKKLKP